MKKLIFIIALLLIPIAFADEIEVYSFKVFNDGVQENVDWEDDNILSYPGSTLQVQIRFENNYNQTISVDSKGILYDIGDDIERTEDFDIDEDEKHSVVFEYYLPTDTKEGTYDIEIKYEYTIEDVDILVERTFEIEVRTPKTDIDEVLVNITKALSDEMKRSNDCGDVLANVTRIIADYDTCKTELATCNDVRDDNMEYKEKYENASTELDAVKTDKSTCEGEKSGMFTIGDIDSRIKNAKDEARAQQKKEDDNFMMAVIGIGGVYFYYKNKQKTVGGSGEGASIRGATWK